MADYSNTYNFAPIPVGARVRLTREVDNYPTFYAPPGTTGTLVTIDENGYWVRLDQHHPDLNQWQNQIQIWDHDDPCENEHPLASLERIADEPKHLAILRATQAAIRDHLNTLMDDAPPSLQDAYRLITDYLADV